MKHLAIVAPDDLSTVIFAKRFAMELAASRPEIRLTTFGAVDQYAEDLAALPLTHVDVPMHRYFSPLRDLGYMLQLAREMRRRRTDTVITFTTKPNIYGVLAARLAGTRQVVMAVRGLGRAFLAPTSASQRLLRQAILQLYRLSAAAADLVWFSNQKDRDFFLEYGLAGKSKTFLTKNAVNLDDFRPGAISDERLVALRASLGLGPTDKVVVMVARLIASKGVREFARAAGLLREALPNTKFLFIGPEDEGPGSIPAEEIRGLESEANFRWLGFRKDVRALYALCDLAVLPSYYKEGGYPRALLEPMAFGKPVVAADTLDCRGPVEPSGNGLLVAPRDAEGLAQAMRTILSEPGLAGRMGRRSLELVRGNYDDRIVAWQVLERLGVAPRQ